MNQPVAFWAPGFGSEYMWFGYDPLGRCVKRWKGPGDASEPQGATFLYYEGWNLIQDGPGALSPARWYVHGARVDEIVKQIVPVHDWERFLHYDARTHCTLQTDASANVVEQYECDAFGKPYYYDLHGNNMEHSPWGNRFLFTGREWSELGSRDIDGKAGRPSERARTSQWLSDLGIYDYRNRLYHPELGRFLQPDPLQFSAGDYNLYRYCHNDPINKTDPMGLDARDFLIGVMDSAGYGMGSAQARAFGDTVNTDSETYDAGLRTGVFVGVATGATQVRAAVSVGRAVGPVAGKITSYSRHALNQAISREGTGVSTKAILDAVRNPIKVIQQAAGKVMYQGQNARVILNKDGKVVTVIPNNRDALRKIPSKEK